MFVLFISCSKLQKYIPHRFQGKWKTPAIMVCTGYDVGGDLGGGYKSIAPKMEFWGLRAQRAFGAHQVSQTFFMHIENFWQKQILQIVFCDF